VLVIFIRLLRRFIDSGFAVCAKQLIKVDNQLVVFRDFFKVVVLIIGILMFTRFVLISTFPILLQG
jgi:hypothetical protein